MRFLFITAVWGREYTDLFLNIAVPNQLSPGNLPAFRDQDAVYKIYTTPQDAERIRQSPIYKEVTAIMPIETVYIDADPGRSKFDTMSACHAHAIRAAHQDKEALIFLAPDIVFGDGSFRNLLRIGLTGKRLVATVGMPAVQATLQPVLQERYYDGNGGHIAVIPPRELAKLTLEHLLPHATYLFWNVGTFVPGYPTILWRVGQEGILVRTALPHPLMIRPQKRELVPETTIDGDYILSLFDSENDVYVVTSSDQVFYCSLEFDELKSFPTCVVKPSLWHALEGFIHHNKTRSIFLDHNIRILAAEPSSRWADYEQEADRVVKGIIFWMEHPLLPFLYFRSVGIVCQFRHMLYHLLVGMKRAWQRR